MPLQSIIVVNTAPGCDNLIEQQISADTCNNYIVRITQNTNALGPFNVYVDTTGSTPVYSAQTRQEMLNGVVVQLGPCATPTPTITPSFTPTPPVTPTITSTPAVTPTTTQTPDVTPTITQTPSLTPSFTPSQTNTPTFTQTPTLTQTPTATITVLGLVILLQDGEELLLQNDEPILLEQESTPFLVSSGDSSCQLGAVSLTQTIYASSSIWLNVNRFYTDTALTTPFNGGGLYYTNESGGCGPCNIIDSSGYVTPYGAPC